MGLGSDADGREPLARELTRRVDVGGVAIGGGAPVAVQSMTNTPTTDPAATLAQIDALAEVGCEIARVAIPHPNALDGFARICEASSLPVVADVHFDWHLAVGAIERGAAAVRINPGNIGSWDHVDRVIDAAGEHGVPLRIGVNAGSLDPTLADRADMGLSQKMVASSVSFVEHFKERGFSDVVLSAKAHDVPTTVETYRALSHELPEVPLHLGITEAGTLRQGTVKSACGLGILLSEGIGDTMRVSLTASPLEEVPVAWSILSCLGIRRRGPELVSCPTCGRCQVALVDIAEEVSARLAKLDAPITVAVMGCVVNGPGEARDADIGVACGRGQGLIFAGGKPVRKVPEDRIVDELFSEIGERFS